MSDPAYIFRTIVCDATDQQTMQDLATSMWGDEAVNMLTIPLSGDGSNPPTNYISTGMVPNTPVAAATPRHHRRGAADGEHPGARTWMVAPRVRRDPGQAALGGERLGHLGRRPVHRHG